jgi:hypothetical protein
MAATAVMTVRIDPALLRALKRKAEREGRSVSAEVVRLVRAEVEALPEPRATRVRSMDMFSTFEAPDLDELTRSRASFSRALSSRSKRGRR